VALTHKEIFERYIYAGAIRRNADLVAELFTEDGVYEAPLAPVDGLLPRRLAGREAIRAGIGAFQTDEPGEVDPHRTGYVLHETTDPDVFIVELDATVGGVLVSLVYIFRIRDGLIAGLRDYFRAAA
jgi:ketosteroid isomerase-like protein